MKRIWKTLVFVGMLLLGGGLLAAPQLEPVRLSGRIGVSDEGRPELYWPGTSVFASFEGTSLSVVLDDDTGKPFYNVLVDGQEETPVILDLEPGLHTYAVATNLADKAHTVQLFRRTEGEDGATEFCGFVLDEGAELQAPPAAPTRRIEFFGDSITCGMGNEVPDDAPDENNALRNNYLAYGAITARDLNAEYRCIARSGIGILISWFDLVMPDYWNRLDPLDADSRWDFSTWTPDVVVINLFQNDSWLIGRLDPVPGEEQIVQAYVDFVSNVRAVYPDAHIVCALGRMDATLPGGPWPGYIHQAVERMDDPNMSEQVFVCNGFTKHPRVRHHREMADQLAAHLKDVMGW